jgi:hypothetical protein
MVGPRQVPLIFQKDTNMNRAERRAKAAQKKQIVAFQGDECAAIIDIGPCQTNVLVRLRNDSRQMVFFMTPDEAEHVLELLKRKIGEARSFVPQGDPVENATRILSAFEKMEKLEGTL